METPQGSTGHDTAPAAAGWTVEVFFDGECPLCRREIALLQRLDRGRGAIRATDIAAPGFDPSRFGLTRQDFMARIQGRLPGGEWIEGVEVFRQLYGAVGLRWLMPFTRLPGISHALEAAYGAFARNRLHLTGRCTDDHCAVPPAGARR